MQKQNSSNIITFLGIDPEAGKVQTDNEDDNLHQPGW
jgi:hypothetical protein